MVLLQEDLETLEEFGPLVTHDLDTILALDEKARRIVEAANSQIHGRGYCALKSIAEGELVLSAYGVVIGRQTEQHSIQHNVDIHVQPFAHGGKYLNHSCDGNLIVHSDKRGIANFFARRPIRRGEEVTYYYPMTEFEWSPSSEEKGMSCHCLSEKCEGIIRSFSMLNPSEQKSLIERNYASSYLAKWFREQTSMSI